jgi:nucleotide sugar dehydrogenase
MIKKIGFIGQGWIGKNYADDFEERGFEVIRYALEEPYNQNKEKVKEAEIVFIAVPTPTNSKGFDTSILGNALTNLVDGQIAVIKSTILPGTTVSLQQKNPNIILMHSPEFLTEANAKYDARNPKRNIIGIPENTKKFIESAEKVMEVLPEAPYKKICKSEEAELIKYAGNNLLYIKVVFVNLLYDLAEKFGCDWQIIKEALMGDSRLGNSHFDPIHPSRPGEKPSRGAGGHCFIKDFVALQRLYKEYIGDELGLKVFEAMGNKNVALLKESKKDLDLLNQVYGFTENS